MYIAREFRLSIGLVQIVLRGSLCAGSSGMGMEQKRELRGEDRRNDADLEDVFWWLATILRWEMRFGDICNESKEALYSVLSI